MAAAQRGGGAGDNLGNHTATQDLNLQGNALTGSGADIGNTVGVGVRADGGLNLGENTSGNSIYLGYLAGTLNTGSDNVFLGHFSGNANTTGSSNLFSGNRSGTFNTTGSNNVFSGYQSGNANTTGNENVFSGTYSGTTNTTGSDNVFLGYLSGRSNNTGSGNAFFGYRSGRANTTGTNNTALGTNSGPASGSGGLTNATALGANVSLTQSNTVVLGNGANVGIGTSTPTQKLEVAGSAILSGAVQVDAANANDGTFTGGSPLKGFIFGAAGTGEGIGSNRTGTVNGVGVDIYTNFTPRLSVANSGNVGIGTSAPAASAALDISSTKQGLLVPRMSSTQRTGIGSPATGLMVFDTDSTSLYLYGGAAQGWNKLATLNGRGPVVRGTPQRNLMVWTGTQWRAGSPCEVLGAYLGSFADLPDDDFTDTNCDGVDGNADQAVFVATTGLDTNPGTRAAPLRTVTAALILAATQGKTQVLVSAGTYLGTLPLRNGISVYGGYSAAANWTRDPANVVVISESVVDGGGVAAVTGSSLTSRTVLDRLTLQAQGTAVANASVYGVRCSSCPRLEVRHCTITAGNAGPGVSGAVGAPAAAGGGPGHNGSPGDCDNRVSAPGGGGGSSGCFSGSNGGAGYYGQENATHTGNPGSRGYDGPDGSSSGAAADGTGGSGGSAAAGTWVTGGGHRV